MNDNDKEYLRLLKKHLEKAYKELEELKKKVDLKILEINQVEELVNTLEKQERS